eukprot:gnl/TRDRNA2_/TRDRNA2_169030_c1_seq1.p1 gnl/TRDRNA2_/TRDRNA2_169030_c1~~gnl/TRDRNA2_/TRDRNA2_169030_c1_seq1.p1  ORF type:complete len:173 (-),score=14.82 gnl/TRDRNA2_/TRDRNA2_169030_c1_seq1:49-567(-)
MDESGGTGSFESLMVEEMPEEDILSQLPSRLPRFWRPNRRTIFCVRVCMPWMFVLVLVALLVCWHFAEGTTSSTIASQNREESLTAEMLSAQQGMLRHPLSEEKGVLRHPVAGKKAYSKLAGNMSASNHTGKGHHQSKHSDHHALKSCRQSHSLSWCKRHPGLVKLKMPHLR